MTEPRGASGAADSRVEPAPPVARLRQRVFTAAGWSVAGSALSQAMRFGSNLILTRLLFPEAFGVMAILTAILIGVSMVSDVGLSMSIVRSPRGAEARYLNTVWTMQIAKGLLLGAVLWLAAAPVAAGYNQPLLADMLPVMGLVAVLNGLNSTKADLAAREVRVAAPIVIGLVAQGVGVLVMIVMAWLYPSPWSLLMGNVVSAAVTTAATHLALPGPRNRLDWDASAAREVMQFGGWIMLGSAIAYFSGEGIQLFRAALVDIRFLGLLGLSSVLSLTGWTVIQQLSGRVLFPAYAEVWREAPERQSSVVERSRRVQLLAGGLFSALLAVAGPTVIDLLYDARYADAGLILQVQSAGLMASLLSASYSGVLPAMGRPGLASALLLAQVAVSLLCMAVGAHVAGDLGVVVGGALTGWLFYPINAFVYHRLDLWHPRTDAPMLVCAALVALWVWLRADWSVAASW